MKVTSKLKIALTSAAMLAAVSGSGYWVSTISSADAEAAEAAVQPQAFPVDVVNIEAENIRLWNNFSGRLKAIEEVELQPQVSGTIVDIRFEDGQLVEKGDI
ncbi:MAG: biotin/lipoyl-binding protein, partial [Sneathiella sp.]|nr:biotin/lipoyl-binding protein [Sneathiella sp.]